MMIYSVSLFSLLFMIISSLYLGLLKGLVSSSDRIQMLRLALNSSSWVHVSEWETQQDEWTPTREVIQYHQVSCTSTVNVGII